MKKMIKTLSLCMVFLITAVIITSSFSSAFDVDATKGYIDNGLNTEAAGETDIMGVGGKLLYGVKLIGFVLGTILLVWFGIKWMTANPQERAGLKDQAWNYVIGAMFLFGAAPMAQWLYDMVTTAFK